MDHVVMQRLGRFTRRFRVTLFVVGMLVVVFCLKNIRRLLPPNFTWIDLRNHEQSLPILSPVVEPRLFLEQSLFLLVIISSSPNKQVNAERRNMIRKTWGNVGETRVPNDVAWKVVFMMGKAQEDKMDRAVMAEHSKNGDLLVGDYKDGYRNILIKLLMAFQWASKIKCSYVLKTDDDVYIEIPKVIEWVIARNDVDSLYGGNLYHAEVVRDKSHRHYVTEEDLSLEHYPVYCKGSMMVVSKSLVPKMVDLSKHIKRIGPDDAYVGLLAFQLGLKPVQIKGFHQSSYIYMFINYLSTCQLQELIGIGDSLSPSQVEYIHEVKTSLANGNEVPSTFCTSLRGEFLLSLLLCCTLLLILLSCCCRQRFCLRVKKLR